MFNRLALVEQRYNDINEMLQDPAVTCNVKKMTQLMKELRSLEKTVVTVEHKNWLISKYYSLTNVLLKINDKFIDEETKYFLNNFSRQALHAQSLGFIHPRTKEKMFFEAEMPEDMNHLLNVLRKI